VTFCSRVSPILFRYNQKTVRGVQHSVSSLRGPCGEVKLRFLWKGKSYFTSNQMYFRHTKSFLFTVQKILEQKYSFYNTAKLTFLLRIFFLFLSR